MKSKLIRYSCIGWHWTNINIGSGQSYQLVWVNHCVHHLPKGERNSARMLPSKHMCAIFESNNFCEFQVLVRFWPTWVWPRLVWLYHHCHSDLLPPLHHACCYSVFRFPPSPWSLFLSTSMESVWDGGGAFSSLPFQMVPSRLWCLALLPRCLVPTVLSSQASIRSASVAT